MSQVGAAYKKKPELQRIVSVNEIGDSFLLPLTNPNSTEEFAVEFSRVSTRIGDSFSGATIIAFDDVVYVSGLGDDGNAGDRITEPKQTLASAITAAQTKSPSQTNIIAIICNDGTAFSANVSLPSFVSLSMPNATLTATSGTVLTLADFCFANIGQIIPDGASTIGVAKTSGAIGSRLICQNIQCLNGATGVSHAGNSERLVVEASGIQGSGTLVSNTSSGSGRVIIRADALNINGANGVGIFQNSATNDTFISGGLIGHLEGAQTGTTCIDCNAGTVVAQVGELNGITDIDVANNAKVIIFDAISEGAITVASGGTLESRIIEHNGTLTNNGTILGEVGETTFGAQRLETSLKFGAAGQVVSSISNDTSLTNSSQSALVTEHAVKSYVDAQSQTFQAPAFTAFTVDIPQNPLAGSTFSGTRTFTWTVTNENNLSGNLTISEPGNDLSTSVNPALGTIDLAITSFSLNAGETRTFTISGTDTQSNTPSRTYVITGQAPDEHLFYGLSDSNNPASIDTSTLTEALITSSGQQITASIGPTTAGQFIIVLAPSDNDLSEIVNTAINVNVINTFTKTNTVRSINGQTYNSYVFGPTNSGFTQNYRFVIA